MVLSIHFLSGVSFYFFALIDNFNRAIMTTVTLLFHVALVEVACSVVGIGQFD